MIIAKTIRIIRSIVQQIKSNCFLKSAIFYLELTYSHGLNGIKEVEVPNGDFLHETKLLLLQT